MPLAAGQHHQASLVDGVRVVCEQAVALAANTDASSIPEGILARLEGPLRVAIAGRTKAGKSTLVNALVGERLAATDAGECTRVVTWYRHGLNYEVAAATRDGDIRPLPFKRVDGTLEISLEQLVVDDVARIFVRWPSRHLEAATLIDTPGLGSLTADAGERTLAALLGAGDEQAEADAVIYLMPHVHQTDHQFLDAYLDRSLANPSPINAVAVLSRADEIGGGRANAIESATRIAARYAADERIRGLVSTVLPVAGLLAETATTLREQEVAWLRAVAQLDSDVVTDMLLSVDLFRDSEQNPLGREPRQQLLDRLGLYGLRLSVDLLATGRATSATALAAALLEASGLGQLRKVLASQFRVRADALKARAALAALRSLASRWSAASEARGGQLMAAVERLEASSEELALLRLLHLAAVGAFALSVEERAEVERLALGGSHAQRLGLPTDAQPTDARTLALAGVERWRARAASPMVGRAEAEAAEIAARSYEAIFGAVSRQPE